MRVTFETVYTIDLTDNDTKDRREIKVNRVVDFPNSTINSIEGGLVELAVVDGSPVYPLGTWIYNPETGYYD